VLESTLKGNFLVKDKWRKALHEEEMAQLNNAAGAARTELIGPQTQGSIEEDSDEEKRQHFVLNTHGMEASVDGSAGSTRGMPV
jgi:hypothetical protein